MLLSTRSSRPSRSASVPPGGDRARLRIEGVSSPIVTRIARRRAGALVVEQELPFLRMNARVQDEDGRAARIARVAIDAESEVPKLVLELAYDDEGDGGVEVSVDPVDAGWDRRDQTLGYGEQRPSAAEIIRRDSVAPASAVAPRRERESTLMFRTEAPLARADESVRTSAKWMERRGSDLELAWRALVMRVEAAIDHLARGLAQALAALRTDP